MKNTLILSLLMIILLSAETIAQSTGIKPYKVKSGIIDYSFSGKRKGTGTLYFDDFGARSAMYTESTENGAKRNSRVVISGEYQYMWESDNPWKIIKIKNPLLPFSKLNTENFNITETIYLQSGMVRGANQPFLGKDCKVLLGCTGKVFIWHGILMMIDNKMNGEILHQEATSVSINIPVDPKYFDIPDIKKNLTSHRTAYK